MTNPHPRTRRQLREELTTTRAELQRTKAALQRQNNYTAALGTSIDRAVALLENDGYTVGEEYSRRIEGDVYTFTPPANPKLYTQADFDERHEVTVHQTSRETLKAVIEALELKGYHRPTDPFSSILDERPDRTEPDPERFWTDLRTALEVRAEKKRAEERTATEKKVADLLRRDSFSFSFVPVIDNPSEPTIADLLGDPGPRASSYGMPSTIPTPAPTKPAKKKPKEKK